INPKMTQPIFAPVESLFTNCLKTTYNNQILTPSKIIGPRFTAKMITAMKPNISNNIFFIEHCLPSLTLYSSYRKNFVIVMSLSHIFIYNLRRIYRHIKNPECYPLVSKIILTFLYYNFPLDKSVRYTC